MRLADQFAAVVHWLSPPRPFQMSVQVPALVGMTGLLAMSLS
jgi:hypothetical protein